MGRIHHIKICCFQIFRERRRILQSSPVHAVRKEVFVRGCSPRKQHSAFSVKKQKSLRRMSRQVKNFQLPVPPRSITSPASSPWMIGHGSTGGNPSIPFFIKIYLLYSSRHPDTGSDKTHGRSAECMAQYKLHRFTGKLFRIRLQFR